MTTELGLKMHFVRDVDKYYHFSVVAESIVFLLEF
jgi:hypothetical protein